MSVEPALRDELIAAIPSLRAFALSLTNDPTRADDLVQDALVRAWSSFDRFERGTNLHAWLFTILRNNLYSEHRKRRREVEDVDGVYAGALVAAPEQPGHLDLDDFRRALAQLPLDQREALILVGAQGFSYEEAAGVCGCAVGTIKSRVNRARARLAVLLKVEDPSEIGPDCLTMAAYQLAA
ncbi:MAG TPA: sigma-70 family RNA polymerase sigma factor [Microvirga sp.]|jgi:RNA polymerase sigma-70 factor (ECF subfamily)|nr:sigma-70 family RNA polymerase sigma factor [Microvirga sp.]